MKKRLFSALISLSFISLLFNQLVFASQSGTSPISSPISTPISSPISGPILTPTPTPISSPISLPLPTPAPTPKPAKIRTISGQIWYVSFHLIGWNHKVAPNVLVEMWNIQNGKYYSTRTDINGIYQLSVENGLYRTNVSDNYGSIFINPVRIIFVNRNINWLNFMGLLK